MNNWVFNNLAIIPFDHDEIEPLESSIFFSLFGIDIEIRWYAICIIIGVIIALIFGIRWSKRLNIKEEYLYWGLALGLIFGLLGARLYFCLFNFSYYKEEPWGIITNIGDGGLAIHGGLLATAIFVIIYCKILKINIFKIVEIVAPGFLIAQACGRWGNFFNQEAHGGLVPGYPDIDAQRIWLKSFLPNFIVNQMYIDDYNPGIVEATGYYQPTFLYESIWNLIGFILILLLRKFYKKYQLGDALFFYLVWYGVGRFIIEFMRTDALILGTLKIAQVVSIIMILLGIVGFAIKRNFDTQPVFWHEYDKLKEANNV